MPMTPADQIRLQAAQRELRLRQAALLQSQQEAQRVASHFAIMGRGIGSANGFPKTTRGTLMTFGASALGALLEKSATAIGTLSGNVREKELALSRAQGDIAIIKIRS